MEQGNTATPDELQQAINSITNGGAPAGGATDVVSQIENQVAGGAAHQRLLPQLQLHQLHQSNQRRRNMAILISIRLNQWL